MKFRRDKFAPDNPVYEIEIGRLFLRCYRGSPWLGFELFRRMLFVTVMGRRFEFRWRDRGRK